MPIVDQHSARGGVDVVRALFLAILIILLTAIVATALF